MTETRGKNLVQMHKGDIAEFKSLVRSHKDDLAEFENLVQMHKVPAAINEKEKIIHRFLSEMCYRPNMIALYIAAAREQNFGGNLRQCNQWVEERLGIKDYSIRSDYNRVGDMLIMMQDTAFFVLLMQLNFNKTRALSGFKDKERLTAFLERCPGIEKMTPDKVWEAVTSTLGTARAKKKTAEGYEQPELFDAKVFRYLEADDQHIYDAAAKLKAKQAYDIIVGGMLYMDCGLVSWNRHHGPMPAADKRDLLEKMEYLIKELRDTPEA